MSINQALALATQKLRGNKIASASLDAEILLSFVLEKPKEFLYSRPEHDLTPSQMTKLKQLTTRRSKGEPIAILTGHKEFYGLNFVINKNVLIPRPETELLVAEALDIIKKSHIAHYPSRASLAESRRIDKRQRVKTDSLPVTLVDIGTGSGCIPITLAKNLSHIPHIKYYGLDISKKALAVAKLNAQLHGLSKKIKFIQNDLLKNIQNTKYFILNTNFIITANLPYLPIKLYASNPELKYEPRQALLAGPDGLKYYRTLLQQIKTLAHITHYPSPITIFLEIDPSQTKNIKKVIHQYFPKSSILIKKDLAGRNRLIIIKLNHK